MIDLQAYADHLPRSLSSQSTSRIWHLRFPTGYSTPCNPGGSADKVCYYCGAWVAAVLMTKIDAPCWWLLETNPNGSSFPLTHKVNTQVHTHTYKRQ